MGGQPHYSMNMDPAIQKLGTMTSNRLRYFRWTPKTAGLTFVYAVIVPTIVGVIAWRTDVSDPMNRSLNRRWFQTEPNRLQYLATIFPVVLFACANAFPFHTTGKVRSSRETEGRPDSRILGMVVKGEGNHHPKDDALLSFVHKRRKTNQFARDAGL
ncbi:hypothetical protein F4777DRAFT_555890 [Nemania sp. FL0916]|nr:hypothetical protein F4777DRAFT_555890 [Nemania sp. FL0916]